MTSWTERYLARALRSIPEPKRADVERELRSSIDDAVEERVGAGEDRPAAERAVLEGLGDPSQLATAYTGKPDYLIGPELFPIFRQFVPRLIATVVPIVATILLVVTLGSGSTLGEAIGAAISAAVTVTIQIGFWTTVTFVFLERAEAARDARTELVAKTGKWTLERLPKPAPGRVSVSEVASEVFTVLLTIGGLLFASGLGTKDALGAQVPLLHPALTDPWLVLLIAVLGSLGGLHAVVFLLGRWTMALATLHAAIQVAFAAPVVVLALGGMLINPAYAAAVGVPMLAEGDGPVMLIIAISISLVTVWEIVTVFQRARRASGSSALSGSTLPAA